MIYARFEHVHTDAVRMMGPYDFVQLTYRAFRVGPNGDEIAYLDDNEDWHLFEDDSIWSDVVIAEPD